MDPFGLFGILVLISTGVKVLYTEINEMLEERKARKRDEPYESSYSTEEWFKKEEDDWRFQNMLRNIDMLDKRSRQHPYLENRQTGLNWNFLPKLPDWNKELEQRRKDRFLRDNLPPIPNLMRDLNNRDYESRDIERGKRITAHPGPGQRTRKHSDRISRETLEDYGLRPKGSRTNY